MVSHFWSLITEHVISPRVDSAEVEERLRRARASLPRPVVWLLGKTQSGKSSIVRAITGSTLTEIGNGFRPCTRTARLYAFPDESDCLIRFLDTRGLGEANYDPAEDIAYCQGQSHLLLVVVRAMDQALAAVTDAARAVRKAMPDMPVIVVQTSLHDGYPPGVGHLLPYPFGKPDSSAAPLDLVRSLERQRHDLAHVATRFVPVDFTLPEDGYSPEFFGLEQLWNAIDAELPVGLRNLLGQQPGLRDELAQMFYRKAWPHIVASSVAAGAAGALPAVGIPLIAAIDAKMFHAIASIYQQPLTGRIMGELGGALGTKFVVDMAGRQLMALIPVVGTAAAALATAANTYALGCTLCWYFAQVRQGIAPTAESLRKCFSQEVEDGRKRMAEYMKHRAASSGA